MTLLILGMALWWGAHLFKRFAPGPRAALGARGYPLIGALIGLSVVLLVLGYRGAESTVYWGASPAWVGINNLLMVLAFYVYAASAAKGEKIWLGTKLRHPQLTAVVIWAFAHLLVNGETRAFVLFGGLLVWALAAMALINAQEGPWQRPAQAPAKKEITALIVTGVMTALVMGVHHLLGVTPWGMG